MLHSGSRNIGKELAERHIAVAEGLPHNPDLPDRDLAVFLAGTPEMDAYRRDLFWAQELRAAQPGGHAGAASRTWSATTSADSAAGRVRRADLLPPQLRGARRRYDGVDLLVTRKGAIRPKSGELGHHPRLDGHRVVHRARPGQRRSLLLGVARRRAADEPDEGAQDASSVDDLAAQTAGVECRKDAGVVDEIPAPTRRSSR